MCYLIRSFSVFSGWCLEFKKQNKTKQNSAEQKSVQCPDFNFCLSLAKMTASNHFLVTSNAILGI